eukprot:comp25993_c0_seq1/m.47070 comp25993_c0_seq1/g.47070  ORF comp25993_c0_seq1/g.47070 comp25993_c0_seq1/m.47070 type:complete len:105 (-) comp25993_c0_seq1:334-648(-)
MSKALSLKMIKEISISFNPFQKASTSTKDFVTRLTSPRLLASNEKFVVNTKITTGPEPPTIDVTFMDGSKASIRPRGMPTTAIMGAIAGRTYKMELDALRSRKD